MIFSDFQYQYIITFKKKSFFGYSNEQEFSVIASSKENALIALEKEHGPVIYYHVAKYPLPPSITDVNEFSKRADAFINALNGVYVG